MRTEGWRGKGSNIPQWKLEARKANNIAANKGFAQGGLPRRRNLPPVVSLPKLKCLDRPT